MNLDGSVSPLNAFDECVAIEPSLNNPNKAYTFVLHNSATDLMSLFLDYLTMMASTFDFNYYYNYVGNAVTFAMFFSE